MGSVLPLLTVHSLCTVWASVIADHIVDLVACDIRTRVCFDQAHNAHHNSATNSIVHRCAERCGKVWGVKLSHQLYDKYFSLLKA